MCGRLHFGCLRRRAAASFTRTSARSAGRLHHAFTRRNGSIVTLIFVAAGRRDSASPAVGTIAVADCFGAGIASVAVVRVVIRALPVAFRSFAGAARAPASHSLFRGMRSSTACIPEIRLDYGIWPVLRGFAHVSANDVFFVWTSRRPIRKQVKADAPLPAGGCRGGGDSGGRKHMAKIN